MPRVVEVSDRLVGTIDRQVYWIRSLVPIETKSKVPQERRQHQRRGRHLDHRAELDRPVRAAGIFELLTRPRKGIDRVPDLAHLRDHGQQDADPAVRGGAQDRAQLLAEHRRLRQAPADGTQAERRVEHMLVAQFVGRHPVERLVGADIDRADRHRPAAHRPDDGSIGLVLLVLSRQLSLAVHEQELAAEQADPGRARSERSGGIAGLLDVGEQLDPLPVARHRGQVPQARQARAALVALAPECAVFLDDRWRTDRRSRRRRRRR